MVCESKSRFFVLAWLFSSFVNVQMLVVLFWLLCVLFVNISSHRLVFFCFDSFKTTFCDIDTEHRCKYRLFTRVCVVFFLFCFICLLFCNCIFLTKNKEITLELYFSSFYFAFPRFFDGGAVSFALFWMLFLFLSPSTQAHSCSSSFYLLECFLIFFCLFLIKDTVNYFLTFLYSCSWIVLLCEFVGVCCRRWPFYGKGRNVGEKLSEKT